ncbi:hypothetical protein KP509_15G003100 [Ceratopteris richardii]|uniref:DNA-directed primase/polymerase protein n=2 Tax=Ceratopteris richardii TaxID=49495 RepID=A0A8T2T6E6_CERRI|nr:hypothetical protein KP509_15G003100 [Ceratopteris richardii]
MEERKREDSEVVADRLLDCLRRGVSPRLRRHLATLSPRTPVASPITRRTAEQSQGSSYACEGHVPRMSPGGDFRTPELNTTGVSSITKEVSPGIFYGSPVGKCFRRQPHVLRLLHEIRRDLALEGYSLTRNSVWATFAKQDQAMQFVQSHGSKEIALFVYQDHLTGQRRFLATTYKEFWSRYELIPYDHRHHYEIIMEGSPCHLYFDLEFDRQANPGLDGNVLIDLLLVQISKALNEVYSLDYDESWTVELDSTTEEKFSRHLIVRIPNIAFKDNSHVGSFVAELCSKLARQRENDESINSLYVLKGQSCGESSYRLFIDQAVYTRNRSFRLPFSSKAGKTTRLVSSGRFCCKNMSEQEIFEASLICKVGEDCSRFLTFDPEPKLAGHGGSLTRGNMIEQKASCSITNFTGYNTSAGKSPFPEVDQFIESIACIEGIPGIIRNWYWFSEYGVLLYNIDGNRFCENIGRQHKSNHVFYIVDFRTAGYYQKCHDPDCRGYKSPLRPIPWHTFPANFQLSSPLKTCHAMAEKSMMTQGQDEHARFLSRLSITNEPPIMNGDSLGSDFSWKEIHVSGEDDISWWEEVAGVMEQSIKKQSENNQGQIFGGDDFAMDDQWWIEVQEELEKYAKGNNKVF